MKVELNLLDALNPRQREAVEYNDGPLLIIAGAGSGKTRVITYKVAYLVRFFNISPRRLFVTTFTNKAAEEMKRRVMELLGFPSDIKLPVATFHSHCARILREEGERLELKRNFTICDEADQLALLKSILKELKLPAEDFPPRHVRWAINQAKMRYVLPEDLERPEFKGQFDKRYHTVYELYQQRLHENNACDFEDLIVYALKLFEKYPDVLTRYQQHYEYVLVDEYQDTNHIQHALVCALAGSHHRVCVVGDEDQSIYSWRGAELGNILDFEKSFPETKIIRLEQNYRSTQNILKAADQLIGNNEKRLGKQLWTANPAGEPLFFILGNDEYDEASQLISAILKLHYFEQVPLKEMAIFYRQNSLSRCFEEKLRLQNIPYRIVGTVRFFDRAEVKDLIAYLNLVVNPHNALALKRVINRPRRGVGEKTLEKVELAAREQELSLFQTMEQLKEEAKLPSAARKGIKSFLKQLHEWQQLAAKLPPEKLLDTIIKDINYEEFLKASSEKLELISRKENIAELKSALAEFFEDSPEETLENFLEIASLSTHADEYEEQEDAITLMTIHCAKGLEFNVVFMVGLEESIFPHYRTVEETGDDEEERRLFYVGLTRAKRLLFLSYALSRRMFGPRRPTLASPFLRELPSDLIKAWE